MKSLKIAQNLSLNELDRSRNTLITGIPGTGVSQFVLGLVRQDIEENQPIVLFDKYGDLAREVITNSDETTLERIAYIDVGNDAYPVGLNLFEEKNKENQQRICSAVINLMYDLYDPHRMGVIGPRFEHAMRNAILSIMYEEKSSFIELLRCLTDANYVKRLLVKIKDPIVLNYWNQQVAQTSDFHKSEVLDYIVSKLGIFVTDKKLRSILGQTSSTINFGKLISEKPIILFDFSNLRRQTEADKIVTTILLLKLIGEMEKNPDKQRSNLNFYIDEVNNWPASQISELLTDNRRYGITLTLTTDKIAEADNLLKRALLRTGTLISFRLYSEDAQIIAPEFHNKLIGADNLCLLKKYQAYIKILQEGNVVVEEKPVNFETDFPSLQTDLTKTENFIVESQKRYGKETKTVESDIQKRMS